MGFSSSLSIGRTALTAYQAALAIVGNNLANSATPGYSRIVPHLAALPGTSVRAGQVGSGVYMAGVKRNISESLQARLRTATSDKESATAQQLSMDRLDGVFNPLGDSNLGTLMGEFFTSLHNLQNSPENMATRGIVINAAGTLADRIRQCRTDLVNLHRDLNTEIQEATRQADQLASQIAELNTQITVAEGGTGTQAAALRDQRDQLLGQLSELFGITVREQPSGAVNVYVGNEALVQFGQSFGLYADTEKNSAGESVAVVKLRINNGQVTVRTGQVAGMIAARDTHTGGQIARLDSLAGALINEINRIHAGGRGLQGYTNLTSATPVLDPTVVLSSAANGLAFPPKSGTFFIDVRNDSTGAVVRQQITVDLNGIGADSTLNSVAAEINAKAGGVTATVLADGRLQLTAGAGVTFSFAEDSSGFLAAIGLNTLFTGSDARDVAVNSVISGDPALLAAATSTLAGDGSNASAMAALAEQGLSRLSGASLNEYYNATMADLAVRMSSTRSAVEGTSIVFDSLTAQREALSGVNTDEEAIAMVSYQRAYQGAARYITVVDEMMQTLLSLVR